ncbi:flippase [Candidatus Nomurabacteria bacterium]|nr:flippase [Candidatus Nomurabacteria bacterium]
MSTTRKIAHNTAVQVIGKAFSTLLGLIALGMMTRYLGQEQFGWYTTTISFLQFVAILIDFGLVPVTASMMSQAQYDKKQLFKNLLGYRFVTSVIFLGIAPLVALFFPYPHEVKIAIAFSTISFLAVAMNQVLIGYYQTQLKMHIPAVGELLGRIALIAGLAYGIHTESGFLPIMGAVVVASVIYTLYLWMMAHRESPAGFGFDKQIWIDITKQMWPIAISIIFNVVYLKGDIVLLSFFSNQIEVGLYGAAYRVLDVMTQTAMMLMGIMLPLLAYAFSHNQRKEFRQHFQRSFDAMMALAVPMMVGTLVLAHPIIRLVAGEEFAESGNILRLLSIAVFGVYLGAVFGHTAVSIGKQKQTMWIYISNAIITLTGYFIFIPRFGMYGAAWMTIFSELYTGLLLLIFVSRYTGSKLNFFTFVKIVFCSLVMGATLIIFNSLHVLWLVILGVLVYALFAYSLGIVSKQTLKEILGKNQ